MIGAAVADYRFIDHTGDFGLELEADDLDDVFAGVARAFADLLTDGPDLVAAREPRELAVSGLDAPDLLVAFANELLYLFEVEGFLCARFEPTRSSPTEVAGTCLGERYDPARHAIARPVKAVTHHAVRCEPAGPGDGGGWRARLIFDL